MAILGSERPTIIFKTIHVWNFEILTFFHWTSIKYCIILLQYLRVFSEHPLLLILFLYAFFFTPHFPFCSVQTQSSCLSYHNAPCKIDVWRLLVRQLKILFSSRPNSPLYHPLTNQPGGAHVWNDRHAFLKVVELGYLGENWGGERKKDEGTIEKLAV